MISLSRAVAGLALILSPALVPGGAAGATIVSTAMYGGKTYHLVAEDSGGRITWSDSEAFAASLGGHLVTINDAAENDFVLGAFGGTALALGTPYGNGLVSLWLGLNDAGSEGTFVWTSGETPSYTNFVPGEPLGTAPDEDYIGMVVSPGFGAEGQWHDVLSDFRANDITYGVVELAAVPEPGTLALALTGGLLVAAGARWRRGSVLG